MLSALHPALSQYKITFIRFKRYHSPFNSTTLAMERIRIETLRKLQSPTRSDSRTDNGHHSTPTNSMTTALEQSQAQLTYVSKVMK